MRTLFQSNTIFCSFAQLRCVLHHYGWKQDVLDVYKRMKELAVCVVILSKPMNTSILLECPLYGDISCKLLDNITETFPLFDGLTNLEKLSNVLACQDVLLIQICAKPNTKTKSYLIRQNFKIRKSREISTPWK